MFAEPGSSCPLPKPRLYVIGLLIAAGLAYGTVALTLDQRYMVSVGLTTEGRMTGDYREVTSSGAHRVTSYYPVFSYRTTDNSVVLGTVSDAVDQNEIRADRMMQLRYDPKEPSTVRLANVVESGPGALVWILGASAALVAFFSIWGLVTGRPLRLPF